MYQLILIVFACFVKFCHFNVCSYWTNCWNFGVNLPTVDKQLQTLHTILAAPLLVKSWVSINMSKYTPTTYHIVGKDRILLFVDLGYNVSQTRDFQIWHQLKKRYDKRTKTSYAMKPLSKTCFVVFLHVSVFEITFLLKIVLFLVF